MDELSTTYDRLSGRAAWISGAASGMGIALYRKDIAQAALCFACDDSAGITGTSLTLDAGYTSGAEWKTDVPTRFME